jgi:hypothetical protein
VYNPARRDGGWGYLVVNYLRNRIGLDRAAACCHTETANSDIMERSHTISCKYIDIDCDMMLPRLTNDYCSFFSPYNTINSQYIVARVQ